MTKNEYFLDLIKAALPAVISRNAPSAQGAASLAVSYALAVLTNDVVQAALDGLQAAQQDADQTVYTATTPAPKAKPGTNKRG